MKNTRLLRMLALIAVLVLLAALPVIAMASSVQQATIETMDRYMVVNGQSNCDWLYSTKLADEYNWFDENATPEELNAAYTFDVEVEDGIEVEEMTTVFTESSIGSCNWWGPDIQVRVNGPEADGKKITSTMTVNATGEQFVQEYVMRVKGVRKAPTIETEAASSMKVVEFGDYVLTIEEGASVTIAPHYETFSGEEIELQFCEWSLENAEQEQLLNAEGNSCTFTNLKNGDVISWYAGGADMLIDFALITVNVVPEEETDDDLPDITLSVTSQLFINGFRPFPVFFPTEAEELFLKDYDGDGAITAEELNANIDWVLGGDSSITCMMNNPFSTASNGTLVPPDLYIAPKSVAAEGKTAWVEISNTRGDKLRYEVTVGVVPLKRKAPTIIADKSKFNGMDDEGDWLLTVEEGTDVTIIANYETLSGDKADLKYSWGSYREADDEENGNVYTIRNIDRSTECSWVTSSEKNGVSVVDMGIVKITVVPKGTLFPPQEMVKTDYEEGISEVPEALQEIPELNTPAKIEAAISIELIAVAEDIGMEVEPENKEVYDVSLQYSPDGGDTWIEADETHWPADGKLTVVLPYPEGTGQYTHNFAVAHMFTKEMNGNQPGTYEFPKVVNTPQGIQFQVTGLSPIALVWEEKPEQPAVPSTGDNADLILWVSLMLLGAAGCFFASRRLKRS